MSINELSSQIKDLGNGISLNLDMDQLPSSDIIEEIEEEAPTSDDILEEESDSEGIKFLLKYGLQDIPYTNNALISYTSRILYSDGEFLKLAENKLLPEHIKEMLYNLGYLDGNNTTDSAAVDKEIYNRILTMAKSSIFSRLQYTISSGVNDTIDDIVTYASKITPPSFAPANVFETVFRLIDIRRSSKSTNELPTPKNIFYDLVKLQPLHASVYHLKMYTMMEYISSVLTIYKDFVKHSRESNEKKYNNASRAVNQYLKSEFGFEEKFAEITAANKMIPIYQILVQGDKFYYKCGKCGELHEIREPLLLVSLLPGDTKDISILALPNMFSCTCGYYSALTTFDVLQLRDFICSAYRKSFIEYKNIASTLSTRLTTGRFTISAYRLMKIIDFHNKSLKQSNALQYALFESVELTKSENDEKHSKEKIAKQFSNCSDEEYLLAAKRFYSMLRSMDPMEIKVAPAKALVKTPELLTKYNNYMKPGSSIFNGAKYDQIDYSYVARYICHSLSLDYVENKNKAFFSLIYAIKENSLLNVMVDTSKAVEIEGKLERIDLLTTFSATTFPPELYPDLLMLSGTKEDIIKENSLKKDDIRSMLHKLKNMKSSLKKELGVARQYYADAIHALEESEEALVFTKIINVNTVCFFDLISMIANEEALSLFNRIADRMIITNNASKMCDRWLVLTGKSAVTLKLFDNAKDNTEAILACKKYINKLGPSLKAGKTKDSTLEEFSLACKPSAVIFENMKLFANGMSHLNPFQLAVGIKKAKFVDARQFGTIYDRKFQDAVQRLDDTLEDYYSDDLETLILTKAGFTAEEISDFTDEIDISLDRYLFLRKKDEDIAGYLERVQKENVADLEPDRYVDYLTILAPMIHDICIIAETVNITALGYSNFARSAFILSLIRVAIYDVDVMQSNELLAIDATIDRKLRQGAYDVEFHIESYRMINSILYNTYYNQLDYLTDAKFRQLKSLMIIGIDKIQKDDPKLDYRNTISELVEDLEKRKESNVILRIGTDNSPNSMIADCPYDILLDSLHERLDKYGIEL